MDKDLNARMEWFIRQVIKRDRAELSNIKTEAIIRDEVERDLKECKKKIGILERAIIRRDKVISILNKMLNKNK